MKNQLVKWRNRVSRFLYQAIFKRIAFRIDPETVHDAVVRFGAFLGSHRLTRKITAALFDYADPALEQIVSGIRFPNPVGLAAGFDKNAQLADILPAVGFGFAEVGSVTGEPCAGNPKPRLWRLKKSRALVVYYGLKNDGAAAVAGRLAGKKFARPIGISLAKTNSPATVEIKAGIADYLQAARACVAVGDYWTVNISCPNAFGGEPFTDPVKLDSLLTEVDKIRVPKPVFLKLSPDLAEEQVDALLGVVARHRVNGFVCTNLTKKRNGKIIDESAPERGGISGRPVQASADRMIARIYQKTGGRYVIIGAGGIFSAEDAYKKIRLGASLVQLITGLIFEGPQLVSDINLGLVRLLKKDGYDSVGEAVGVDIYAE